MEKHYSQLYMLLYVEVDLCNMYDYVEHKLHEFLRCDSVTDVFVPFHSVLSVVKPCCQNCLKKAEMDCVTLTFVNP